MIWWSHLPLAFWCATVVALGLIVGSFLNVAIARLPYGKSVAWPGSRCFGCLTPIKWHDNLPVVSYLLLRGRCRACGGGFGSRHLWVELGTAAVFLALFLVDVVSHAQSGPAWLKPWQPRPGVGFPLAGTTALPPAGLLGVFAAHAALAACLIAAAVIDAGHKIIPPLIPYLGTLVGLVASTLLPWPLPASEPRPNPIFVPGTTWAIPDALLDPIPHGLAPWPALGPPPAGAPSGSWKLGLLTSLVGAAAGTGLIRGVKFAFEKGMNKEALGLGDADLMMLCGAFLGWQIVAVGFFAGALCGLVLRLPGLVRDSLGRGPVSTELPFGPGLALGVAITWLAWPWVGDRFRLLFDPVPLGAFVLLMVVGIFAAGLLLRRAPDPEGAA